jgi:hypothetical protein
MHHRIAALTCLLSLLLAHAVSAETTSASATTTSRSSSTPSAYAIKQKFLSQQQARIVSQMQEAKRCIKDASNPQILRDFQGNINSVPQTDLNNCSRRLQELTRQLADVARSAEQLSRDAEVAGLRAEWVARNAAREKRTQRINSSQ